MKKLLLLGCLLLSTFLFNSAFAAKSDTGEKIDLTDIEARLAELEALVATNQQSIAAANVAISQNASDIATANGAISQNASDIAVLLAAANETLEDKVSGKTYTYRSTGHGINGTVVDDQGNGGLLPNIYSPLQRDFTVGEGVLTLNENDTWVAALDLTGIVAIDDNGDSTGSSAFRFDFPISASGTWSVDSATNEIILTNDQGAQALQASPNGEVLTVIRNEQRLSEGDLGLTFIADAVYIQLPDSE